MSSFSLAKPIYITLILIFRYSQKQLYDIVADVDSYQHFIPFCVGSRVLTPRKPLSTGAESRHTANPSPYEVEAQLRVGFMGVQESYVSAVTCQPYKTVQVRIFLLLKLDSLPIHSALSG